MKKLHKIQEGKIIDGVCGGIAEYLNLDPTVIRVIWAILSVWGGIGILAYIICALIMPRKPSDTIIDV